ncbi:DUF2180 family protein [Xylanimonas protaetiae]|uniref:DUF2180 family protein n=1 Tax=Xylanimonas protaetiae TaxID=2509457 RepID=A0A4P6F040_9MICO|nr:DUF2180 family protein [Xylanimonas protaetiae]QAY69100.1 DUF2180 family protein [Xylanimonas protaetiae]
MRCFDCASEATAMADAVAVCSSCGAGICLEHTLSGHQAEPVTSPGNPSTRRLPGRRLFCRACADGYVVDNGFAERVDAALVPAV